MESRERESRGFLGGFWWGCEAPAHPHHPTLEARSRVSPHVRALEVGGRALPPLILSGSTSRAQNPGEPPVPGIQAISSILGQRVTACGETEAHSSHRAARGPPVAPLQSPTLHPSTLALLGFGIQRGLAGPPAPHWHSQVPPWSQPRLPGPSQNAGWSAQV